MRHDRLCSHRLRRRARRRRGLARTEHRRSGGARRSTSQRAPWRVFLAGMLVTLGNPKIIVF